MTPLRVRILAYDGVEALDFAGPFEVFTTAARVHQRLQPGALAPFEVASVAHTRAGEPVQALVDAGRGGEDLEGAGEIERLDAVVGQDAHAQRGH